MLHKLKNIFAPKQRNFFAALCLGVFLTLLSPNLFAGTPTRNPGSGMPVCDAVRGDPRPPGCPPQGRLALPIKENKTRKKTDAALFGGLTAGRAAAIRRRAADFHRRRRCW